MKINIVEKRTEIEADARELRESNGIAGNFANLLRQCFRSSEPFDDDNDDEDEEVDENEDP